MSRLQTALGAYPAGTIVTPNMRRADKEYNAIIDAQVKEEAIQRALAKGTTK